MKNTNKQNKMNENKNCGSKNCGGKSKTQNREKNENKD